MEYRSPENGYPFSADGMLDLANQCLDASRSADSALLEMAGLALRRIAHSRLQAESPQTFNQLLGLLKQAENRLTEGSISYHELSEAASKFQDFADRLRKTELCGSST